jgi:lactoylglutathione lyase
MRFGYTILYVGDVAASVAFYGRAFGLEPRLVHDSGQYAELETGATALAFASHELAAENVPGHSPAGGGDGFEVCLVTEGVADAYRHAVDAGAEGVSEPDSKPWGQEVAYVRDPDGVLIEIASPA